jgi:hypothetical protein
VKSAQAFFAFPPPEARNLALANTGDVFAMEAILFPAAYANLKEGSVPVIVKIASLKIFVGHFRNWQVTHFIKKCRYKCLYKSEAVGYLESSTNPVI